jgi:hypothetical protein
MTYEHRKHDELCKKCGRINWSPLLGPVDGRFCTSEGSYDCENNRRLQELRSAVRSLLASPGEDSVRRTARMILGDVDYSCPLCQSPLQLNRDMLRPHYSTPTDKTLCPGSFRRVKDGKIV